MNKLKSLIATFNRTAGQLVRRYNINPADFLKEKLTARNVKKSIEDMRREAERQKIAREVARQEAEAEAKKQAENAMNLMKINNIIYTLKAMADTAKTALARTEIQNSVDVIIRMINDSLQTWNDPGLTAEGLSKYMTKHDRGIERLACAIYDEEYNTNSRYYEKDAEGEKGRLTYLKDMNELAKMLYVPLPTIYYL